MRIAFPYNNWRGRFLKSIQKTFDRLGFETRMCNKYSAPFINKVLRRVNIKKIVEHATTNKEIDYNRDVIKQLTTFKPDIFYNISGSNLYPETIKKIRDDLKCTTVCFVADNPCDPASQRDKYFAMSLRYYDILLLPEPIWMKIINNLAPQTKVIPSFGGYDPDLFHPVNNNCITEEDIIRFSCDVSFTGASYFKNPEGSYRAGILGQLTDFNIKLWGDKAWQYRFQFYSKLSKAYQGNRLSYEELRKLYTISSINLNIPSPQILTGFQPRVFEIAATKGFQIIDHSNELYKIFDEEEVVTFKNLGELKEKIRYYLDHDKERENIIEKMHNKVVENYTWKNQVKKIINEF